MEETNFLREFDEKLWDIARSLVARGQDQEDLVGVTMLSTFKLLRGRKPTKVDMRLLLLNAKRDAINYLRKGKSIDSKKREGIEIVHVALEECRELEERLMTARGLTLEDIAIAESLKRQIEGPLNEVEKDIFEHLVDGYSIADIAKMHKRSHEGIRKHVKKIKQIVARCVSNQNKN